MKNFIVSAMIIIYMLLFTTANAVGLNITFEKDYMSVKYEVLDNQTVVLRVFDETGGLVYLNSYSQNIDTYIKLSNVTISQKYTIIVDFEEEQLQKIVTDSYSYIEPVIQPPIVTDPPKKSGGGGSVSGVVAPIAIPTPTPTPIPAGFSDVSADFWGFSPITELVKRKIVDGYEDNTFKPNNSLRREEFAKLLTKAFELSLDEKAINFSDVNSNDWFYQYALVCNNLDLIKGDGTSFGVGKILTRQDMATIIYRLVSLKEIPLNDTDNSITFSDQGEIANYAKTPIEILVRAGIFSGVGNNKFDPKGECTRAMAAKVIYLLIAE